jgi:hypothetical protein
MARVSSSGLRAMAACEAGGGATPSPAAGVGLHEGQVAPGFELPSAAGGGIKLSDYRGSKPVLLYFSMGPG